MVYLLRYSNTWYISCDENITTAPLLTYSCIVPEAAMERYHSCYLMICTAVHGAFVLLYEYSVTFYVSIAVKKHEGGL